MEDELFRMFGYMNIDPGEVSGQMTEMMMRMVESYERAVLEEMKRTINRRLGEMQAKAQGAQSTQGKARTGTKSKRGTGQSSDDLNPFTILGVDVNATDDELKAAYRKKAWDAHPDHGGSNEQMTKVNAAYEVICRFRGLK
jgi:hypothetical protein